MSESVVWKFPLEFFGGTEAIVSMPRGSRPLHIAVGKDGLICVWSWVVPTEPYENVHFKVYGTGWPIDRGASYVGTIHKGEYVWHVWQTYPAIWRPRD